MTDFEYNYFEHVLTIAEEKLGISKDVISGMHKEDDWSFIIKLSAFVEKILNYMLASEIKDKYLAEFLINRTISEKIKLAFSKNIIDKEIKKKLIFVTELRNKAAHNIVFKFFNNEKLQTDYERVYSNVWIDGAMFGSNKINRIEFTRDNPKLTIFFDCIGCLAVMSANQQHQIFTKETDELRKLLLAKSEVMDKIFPR